MLIEGLYKVDELISSETEITAKIRLNAAHDIFKGHFPGNPIMPGVCMMQIIKELTEKELSKKLLLQTSTNIKFMAKINPEIHPNLVLNISYSEEDGILKLKNSTFFEETLALKMNAKYKVNS
ncbi:MAG: 3-hydroxyacyl-ACP dehydratase [Flavobacteriaceae bacterium]|nr:3-hydroxyacyl-ACP dehydratase [Flavobacteriaceae bacterium]